MHYVSIYLSVPQDIRQPTLLEDALDHRDQHTIARLMRNAQQGPWDLRVAGTLVGPTRSYLASCHTILDGMHMQGHVTDGRDKIDDWVLEDSA